MGLLDNIFGGGQQQSRGGSPLTMALLALLAYRTYQGKGRLADMLGRGQGNPSGYGQGNDGTGTGEVTGRVSGTGGLPGGNPAGPLGGTGGGGLGDLLGGILGGGAGSRPMGGAAGMPGGGMGDLLRGGLGGLLGGAAGGALLNGGLGGLLRQFQDKGYGDAADSWVGRGPNRALEPQQLEDAVGCDTVQELADHSGRPYMDVLSELSQSLPDTVDQLTPEGRLPTDEEAARW
jgi:uncharacterized protein YidB (DUF937 family)